MEDNYAGDTSPPWAELPDDALSEISGHLHEVGDFVRFHAVCRPWRQAPTHTRRLLPCLIEQGLFDDYQYLDLYSPFSGKLPRTRTILILTALAGKTLECSDTSSGRVLARCESRDKTVLINPLTGDATSLPALPKIMDSYGWTWRGATGIVCNGSVMFNTRISMGCDMAIAMLRPGETNNWEEVDVTACLDLNDTEKMDKHTCRALTLCSSGVLNGGRSAMAKLPRTEPMTRRCVVESQGELMCFDVLGTTPRYYFWSQEANTRALISVAVHVMEVDEDVRPRWVKRKHGRGIEHLCFFLNLHNSSGFSIDAREFTGGEVSGGCAYFVEDHQKKTERRSEMAVYRYNFKDGTAVVVDLLPDGFVGVGSMWYMPRPTISAVRSPQEQ